MHKPVSTGLIFLQRMRLLRPTRKVGIRSTQDIGIISTLRVEFRPTKIEVGIKPTTKNTGRLTLDQQTLTKFEPTSTSNDQIKTKTKTVLLYNVC